MTSADWSAALLSAAGQAVGLIGAAIAAGLLMLALVWGVSKGFQAFRAVQADTYDGASGADAGDYAYFYKDGYDSVHDDFDDADKHAFATAYANNAVQQGWSRD